MTKINKLHFNGVDYDIGDKDIHDLTEKCNLSTSDEFMIADSGGSYCSKKATLENITNAVIGNMYSESTCADGDLTISAGNVTCRANHYFMCAKEWNFNNFTICPGITVMFCGNDEPVIKVGGMFCNEGIIDTYGPKTEDYINFMNGSLYAKGVKDRPAFECNGGSGTIWDECCGGYGGGIGESGCASSYGCAGGTGNSYAGGGGGGGAYVGCNASGTCGGTGGSGSSSKPVGGGGGFGLTKGGNGGTCGGNGGNSLYGNGGNGGGTTTGLINGGDGGNSLYGTGGNGGASTTSNSNSGNGGDGRHGGNGGTTSCNCNGGDGGNAYSWHYGLTIIANDFSNSCILACGGNGGNGGNQSNNSSTGNSGSGGNGGNGGNVTILYHNMCNRGDILTQGGYGGSHGKKGSCGTCLFCLGKDGRDGIDGCLIIGQI